MELVSEKIKDFCEILASDAPAPGGGSTAALMGALGAALTGMVASLTIGRKKYADHEQLMTEIKEQARVLRLRFVDIIDSDAEAFNGVSAVFAMPNVTDAEKADRKKAMQSALKACTLTPFQLMECADGALELISKMQGNYNENAASDLGVAVLSIKATIQGAWLNVLINLGGIHDEEFTETFKEKGKAIIKKALPLADKIYTNILESL